MGVAKAQIVLLPWDPDSPSHVERLYQQRIACGWNKEAVEGWRQLQREGKIALHWVVRIYPHSISIQSRDTNLNLNLLPGHIRIRPCQTHRPHNSLPHRTQRHRRHGFFSRRQNPHGQRVQILHPRGTHLARLLARGSQLRGSIEGDISHLDVLCLEGAAERGAGASGDGRD